MTSSDAARVNLRQRGKTVKRTMGVPYRVGFVGAGNVSKMHLDGIKRHNDQVKVVALCDPDETALKTRAAERGLEQTYTDLGQMIARADLDAVVVCTPTNVRKAVLFPLIEAGIPALCEKPFAETYGEAAEIEKKARKAGVPVAINQNFRRHFSFLLARDVLDKGHLGRPLHLAHNVMTLRRDKGWRLDRKRYVMTVMSIHWFDGYRYMLRDEAESVYCRAVNSPATPGGEDTAVSVVIQFRGGAVASLSESFSSFTRHNCCILDCEKGGLQLEYQKLTETPESGEKIERPNPFDKLEATYWLLEDLLTAAKEGREPETSVSDNLNTLRIMEAAYRSLSENRVVRTEEIR